MAFYLKINGKYSVTVNNEVKRLDDKEAEFKKFRSASSAALQIIWIKRTNFKVDKYEIVPDEQPLQIDCGIQTHDIARDMICTTGAYLMPFSYTDSSGNTRFAWMVTGFYEGTYRDGEEINVTESGTFLDALMPPEEEDDRTELYIIQSLQANGFKRIELALYKNILEDISTTYARKLQNISLAGKITKIPNTLDKFLLDTTLFSQELREILVDTFGRDRTDIYLNHENALVIGTQEGNSWLIHELPMMHIPGKDSYSPQARIQAMMSIECLDSVDLEEYYKTGNGYITTVYPEMVLYAHGDTEQYENLEDDVLEGLALEVKVIIQESKKDK